MIESLEAAPSGSHVPEETFVKFGPGGRLMGVLGGPCDADTVLLLPSAGLQPRSGPFRLHTQLARRLARQGVRTFRYDLPGVGEAPRLPDCDAVQATTSAMDQLAAHGCRHFAVGGICSAADTGWDAAVADSRVSALLLLDGICFTGPWYHLTRSLQLLRRLPREWRRFLGKVPGRLRRDASLDANAFRTWPERNLARQQFNQLVSRNVRLLCIFSGGYAERFLSPRQFDWSFGPAARDPGVVMHYWPDCDHTYFGHAQRERLITAVSDWMRGPGSGARE